MRGAHKYCFLGNQVKNGPPMRLYLSSEVGCSRSEKGAHSIMTHPLLLPKGRDGQKGRLQRLRNGYKQNNCIIIEVFN